jgi:hypothetical protein
MNKENLKEIINVYYDINIEDKSTKKRKISTPRFIYFYFCKKLYPKMPLREIAVIGTVSLNHATALHGIKSITNWYDTDRQIKKEVNDINTIIEQYDFLESKNSNKIIWKILVNMMSEKISIKDAHDKIIKLTKADKNK